MKKTLLTSVVSSALLLMGSANAATYYLDGQSLPTDRKTINGNLVASMLVEG